MKLPCESGVWYLLPSIKSELARELVKRGLSQKDVAERLDTTQAAVSQYISNKRGRKRKLSPEFKKEIKKLAREITSGKAKKDNISQGICRICMKSR